MNTNYWIGVVSAQHVLKGAAGGFAQLCHGKKAPLAKMKEGDWLIYYSPRDAYPDGKLLRSFTAIGKVKSGNIYPYQMAPNFIPYRLDIDYYPCHKIGFYDIKSKLEFVQETKHLGFLFRRGHFEISKKDFLTIAQAMGVNISGMAL
ncbi:EVE domain-containing protein [Bacillus subtilis]|uniref:EVE domain-containing protein n=1 Tax=Bacillus subtilis TaxID=1423 RepID=UPI0023EB18C0|nr:EVE domain-containing protein [Bacillus subtilis]MDF4200045.1 EVE domain-containing protein [Bacillus subtilis]MDF4218348.1 EVE domain-containing protein [Bacillus subtilis]MEC3621107.1 EVE domain-containing protein [Bacillus subtilis]MEC3636639.1 EVE domain-containing protein [Bacillus subtilis]MEC3641493.1 EVE domain-containing protein [Bacillus subtilis]